MILLQLFWSFFQIGLFSFGGGNAAMPFIQAQVVDTHGWLTLTEFAEKFNCDSAYVSKLVIISTILSIGTIPLIMLLV